MVLKCERGRSVLTSASVWKQLARGDKPSEAVGIKRGDYAALSDLTTETFTR